MPVLNDACVEISGGTFGSINANKGIGSLLKDGYGFCIQKNDKKTWYDETCSETYLSDGVNTIPVAKLPITGVRIAMIPEYMSTEVEYNSAVGVESKVTVAEGYSHDDVSWSWFRDGKEVDKGSLHYTCEFGKDDIGKNVTVTLKATLDGYTRSTSVTFHVEKAVILMHTIPTVKKETLIFGDGTALFQAGTADEEGVTYWYRVDKDGAWVNSVPKNSGLTAGQHTIYWYISGGDLYKDLGSESEPAGEFTVDIQKATLSSGDYALNPRTCSYSATAQELVTVGFDKVGAKFWYKLGDGDWQDTIPTATDARTYTVSYYIDGGTNYNDVGSEENPIGSIEVTIAPYSLTIVPLDVSKTYGEADSYKFNFGSVLSNALEAAFKSAVSGQLGRAEGEDVGDYAINSLGTLSAGNNFNLGLDITRAPKLTITAKDVTETGRTENQNVIKGIGDFVEPTFQDDKGNTITGTLAYRIILPMTYAEIRTALKTGNAGATYSIGYTFTANGNYTGTITGTIEATIVDVEFTIGDDAVTIATNGTYGASWAELVQVDESKITATLNGAPVAGTYTIVPDNGTLNELPKAGDNYFAVAFNSADGTYQNFVVYSHYVTLDKKPVTVSAGTYKVTKTYDGTTDPGTVSGELELKGIVGNDKVEVTVKAVPDYESADVGVIYRGTFVELSGEDKDNYQITNTMARVANIPCEITPAPITVQVTPSNVSDKEYNGTTVATVTEVTFVGLKNGESLTLGEDYTVTAEYDNSGVGATKDVSGTVTLKDTEKARNYSLTDGSFATFGIITPKSVTAVLTVPDKQYDGKTDAVVNATIAQSDLVAGDCITITGITGTFSQSNVGENLTVTVDATNVTITGAENYNVTIPTGDLKGNIVNNWRPVEGTEFATSPRNSDGWLNDYMTITAKDGYEVSRLGNKWETSITWDNEGNGEDLNVSFYVRNKSTGAISLATTITYDLDRHPEGQTNGAATVSFVDTNYVWNDFVSCATFDRFFNSNVTVQVSATDVTSGVKTVEYVLCSEAGTLAQVRAITDWQTMSTISGEDGDRSATATATIPVEDGKQFICYIRVTDKAGNLSYYSSDGAQFDTTPPAVTGVEDGEIAYTTRVVTIRDRNLVWVKLNGENVDLSAVPMLSSSPTTGKEISVTLTLEGNKKQEYVIETCDGSGNVNSITITMLPISDITAAASDLMANNVTSDSRAMLQNMQAILAEELKNSSLTESEKQELEKEQQKVDACLNKLNTVSNATGTDDIRQVRDITASSVQPGDKTKLENAKADLEKALTDHKDNLTDAEQKSIREQVDTIDKALNAIENVENVEKLISELPKTITGSDSKAVKTVEDAYNALTDHEKTLIGTDSLKKLQDAGRTLAGASATPSTGDSIQIALWAALLFISGSGLLGVAYRRKSKRVEN